MATRQLLSGRAYKEVWTVRKPRKASSGRYSMGGGFSIATSGSEIRYVTHSGSQEEAATKFAAYPNTGDAFVFASNSHKIDRDLFVEIVKKATWLQRHRRPRMGRKTSGQQVSLDVLADTSCEDRPAKGLPSR